MPTNRTVAMIESDLHAKNTRRVISQFKQRNDSPLDIHWNLESGAFKKRYPDPSPRIVERVVEPGKGISVVVSSGRRQKMRDGK